MQRSLTRISLLIFCAVFAAGAYIVKKGDTLWDLSAQFLNNPFAWNDLWQQNKQVKDPHWIYPGDSLYISGMGDSAAAHGKPAAQSDTITKLQAADTLRSATPPPADSALPKGISPAQAQLSRDNDFRNKLGRLPKLVDTSLVTDRIDSTHFIYRPTPPPEVFNRYYQLLAPKLQTSAQFTEDPAWFGVQNGEENTTLQLHIGEEVLLHVGKKNGHVKPGDMIELWDVTKIAIQANQDSVPREYALEKLAAFAKVEAVGDTLTRAHLSEVLIPTRVAQIYAHVLNPPPLIKITGYKEIPEARYEKMPRVRYAADPDLTIGIYRYIVADGGLDAGLNPGDGVAFLENEQQDPSLPPHVLGRGIVVSSSPNASVILVREIVNPPRKLELRTRIALTHRAIRQ